MILIMIMIEHEIAIYQYDDGELKRRTLHFVLDNCLKHFEIQEHDVCRLKLYSD